MISLMPDNAGQDVEHHVQTDSWFYIAFLKVIYAWFYRNNSLSSQKFSLYKN